MQVKSFAYQENVFGTYYKRGLLNLQKMDDHIAKMLGDGWEILTQTSHGGDRRILRPFAKRDTITVAFQRKNEARELSLRSDRMSFNLDIGRRYICKRCN
ncbi:MAG TPA: hypothetical protein VKX49_06690 [Bryobacteraceae bacterium]|nr:hypothetical protein [Bryobacteraceae bacterium]